MRKCDASRGGASDGDQREHLGDELQLADLDADVEA
jgi:hypothetical protein